MEKVGRLPDYLVACVGGGSNAMGLFHAFLNDASVKIVGVEPAGKSFQPGEHAATMTLGTPGMLHGMITYLLQDDRRRHRSACIQLLRGWIIPASVRSIRSSRTPAACEYVSVNDKEALDAFATAERDGRHHSGAGKRACGRPCR